MRVVLCNTPTEEARPLARELVSRGLAACVNVIPAVTSVYGWKGDLVEDSEATLLIKVAASGVEALRAAIVELHPYEVPEVVVLGVDVHASHKPYVDWVRAAGPSGDKGEGGEDGEDGKATNL